MDSPDDSGGSEMDPETHYDQFGVGEWERLEGVASVMEPELADASEEAVEAVKKVVSLLKDDRTVADLSAHILAVSRQ